MDSIVRGVAKSQTRLSDFHFHFQVQLSKCPPPARGGQKFTPGDATSQ